MTGRELKRLRLKRSAIASRQRRQEETFRPDVKKAALNEDPRNAYDSLVQAIYEDINKEKDNDSSSTEESASTDATSHSSSAGQEQELTVTAVPTSPIRLDTKYEKMDNHDDHKVEISTGRLSKGKILRKKDTLAQKETSLSQESVDEYKSPASSSQYNYFGVDLALTRLATQIQSVNNGEVKSNRSTDNDFSKQPRSLEDRRQTRLREKQKFDNFLRGEDSSRLEVRQQILEHNHDSRQTADSAGDANDITSVNSSSSYDTYGFDTFGFTSPNQRSEIQSAIDDAVSVSAASALSDTFEFILEHRSSPEVEEIQKSSHNRSGLAFVANNFKFAMRKYARRKTRPLDDDEKSTTSMKKTASAEARRLRSLRLRVTTIGRNTEPLGSLEEKNEDKEQAQEEQQEEEQDDDEEEFKEEQMLQEEQVQEQEQQEDEEELLLQEQLQEKASSGALQCDGESHQVEQENDDEDKYIIPKSLSRLSIISELTFVSDKLLSKVDELSFLCGNQTSMTCQSETEYCRRMDCEELDPPSDTEDPSIYFDASMKTPPRYLLNPTLKDDFLEKRENGISGSPAASNRLKGDELNSIGQNGAEILLPQLIPSDNQVEHVLTDCPNKENTIDKETTKKKELHGIFGRIICLFDDMEESDDKSQGSTSFSRIWREETPNVEEKYENAAPGLSVSTVSIEEEDYASYYIENSEEYIKDLENYGNARQIYSC